MVELKDEEKNTRQQRPVAVTNGMTIAVWWNGENVFTIIVCYMCRAHRCAPFLPGTVGFRIRTRRNVTLSGMQIAFRP